MHYNPNLAQIDTNLSNTTSDTTRVPLTEHDGFIEHDNNQDETKRGEREEHLRLQNAIRHFINSN